MPRRRVAPTKIKPEPYEPVVVTWEDAYSTNDDHDSVDLALRAYRPVFRKSIGIYVGIAEKDGRRALLIATEDDRAEDSPSAIGGLQQIPVGMVISCLPIQRRKK